MRYRDQDGFEIYDWYDFEAKEEVPKIILDAPVLRENTERKIKTVDIDYPVIGGFTLASTYDGVSITEMGRKAFVRGERYKHPIKNYNVEIVEMAPTEYLGKAHAVLVRNGSKFNFEELIDYKLDNYDLDVSIAPYAGKMFYPYLDYQRMSQEGIHRAVWAERENISRIPVIIVR